MPSRGDGLLRHLHTQAAISSPHLLLNGFASSQVQIAEKKGITMKIRPTSNTRGVLVELGPEETQIPAQSLAAAPVFKLRRILVPIDFSDCSKKALDYAIPFTRQFGAELNLLHVVEPYPAVPEMAPYDAETIEEGRLELEALRKDLGNVGPCSTLVRKGAPPTEITSAARDLDVDLIIISTHGRKGLSRMFLGSTAERIVRSAPCPVLIVRECEREFVPDQSISYPDI
jgi:universal stress protein A